MWEAIWRPETLFYLLLALYLPACFGLIAVVLFQQGKGAGFAGAFGVGPSSDAVFGPRASKNLLQRLTGVMAAVFMVLAVVMSMVANHLGRGVAPELEAQAAIVAGEAEDAPARETSRAEAAPAVAPDLFEPAAAPAEMPEDVDLAPEAAPDFDFEEAVELHHADDVPETAPDDEAETAEEAAPESAETP